MDVYSWGSGGCGVLAHGAIASASAGTAVVVDDLCVPTRVLQASGKPQRLRLIACGGCHCLAVDDSGVLLAWGENQFGQRGWPPPPPPPPPSASGTVSSVAGSGAAASVADHKTAGSSPLPLVWSTPVPVPLSVALRVRSLACGWWHSALVTETGDCYMWGYAKYGQVGIPPAANATDDAALPEYVSTPQLVRFGDDATSKSEVMEVSCGYKHSAAVRSDGTVWVWGDNSKGQLGLTRADGSGADPIRLAATPKLVTAYAPDPLPPPPAAVKSKKKSKLPTGALPSAPESPPPAQPSLIALPPIRSVRCGWQFTAALSTVRDSGGSESGSIFVFGQNTYGQCALPAKLTASADAKVAAAAAVYSAVPAPVRVSAHRFGSVARQFVSIDCGWHHVLALASDNTLWSWGRGDYGQRGIACATASAATDATPHKPPHSHSPQQIVFPVASSAASAAATVGVAVVDSKSSAPAVTSKSAVIRAIACGAEHSLALTDVGLFGWGWNEHGNLATPKGDTNDRTAPTKIDIPAAHSAASPIAPAAIHGVCSGGASVLVLVQSQSASSLE